MGDIYLVMRTGSCVVQVETLKEKLEHTQQELAKSHDSNRDLKTKLQTVVREKDSTQVGESLITLDTHSPDRFMVTVTGVICLTIILINLNISSNLFKLWKYQCMVNKIVSDPAKQKLQF